MNFRQATTLQTTLTLGALLLLNISAFAQSSTGGDSAEQPVNTALHERVRGRIHADTELNAADRQQMMQNLESCLRLGLRDDQVEGIFPMGGPHGSMGAEHLLAVQGQVIQAAHAGMPADLLADKFREGRMKRAAPEMIDQAMNRMGQYMSVAHHQMNQAVEDGVTPTGDERTDRHLHRGLALDMWRGLTEEDMGVLRDHAMERTGDHGCSMIEFAAAAETATELIEYGVPNQRSRNIAGMGLEQGYSAEEMRQLGRMMHATGEHGGPDDEMLGWMEQHMADGEHMDQMTQHMVQMGWLGPRDMHGPGGHSPVDDVMGGPGHPGSGHMGGGDHGGGMHGSGDGSGSNHGGSMGGPGS